MRRAMLVCLCVLAMAHAVPARAYQEPTLLFNFEDPAITESSGVAASDLQDGVLFTHNDSGDYNHFFAIGPKGETLVTFTIAGEVGYDVEDIARGPGIDGKPALFLGDIGDNSLVRPFVTVYEFPEPVVSLEAPGGEVTTTPSAVHHLVYEDPRHNAETLLVDPKTGRIAIVTKDSHGKSGVYVAQDASVPGGPQVLHKVATINLDSLSDAGQVEIGRVATGGDISPDGTKLVVRTYLEGFEWPLANFDLAAAVAHTPSIFYMPDARGGEAIGYTREGTGLITTTEGIGAPVHLLAA